MVVHKVLHFGSSRYIGSASAEMSIMTYNFFEPKQVLLKNSIAKNSYIIRNFWLAMKKYFSQKNIQWNCEKFFRSTKIQPRRNFNMNSLELEINFSLTFEYFGKLEVVDLLGDGKLCEYLPDKAALACK